MAAVGSLLTFDIKKKMGVFSDENRKHGEFKTKHGEFISQIGISPYFTNKNWGLPVGSGADLTRPACSMGSQARSFNRVTTMKSLNG